MNKTITTGMLIIAFFISAVTLKAQKVISLPEAINIAMQNNPAIKAGENQIKVAEAKYMQAHSTFLPQASLLTKYFVANNMPEMYPLAGVSVPVLNHGVPTGDNIIMHPMAPFMNRTRDVATFDLNLVYPLYAGKKRINAVNSTKKLKEVYSKNLLETKAELRLKVKTAYYNILFVSDVINVYQQVLNQLNDHLRMAEAAYKEGVRSEFDVLDFKSKIEEFKSRIVEVEGKKVVAETALKNLLALPDNDSIAVKGSLNDYPGNRKITLQSLADINRSNYKVQSLQNLKEVLGLKEKIEAAGNLPTLFTFGNYHIYHGKDFPPFDKTWRNGFAVGIGLKINLFDGNMTKGKKQEIQADIDRVQNFQQGLKLQLRYQYNKSLENIQSLEAQKKAALAHLAVAQKAYQIAEVGYKNGVITNIELNDSQLNVTKVKLSLLNIQKNLLLEYANLAYLSGN